MKKIFQSIHYNQMTFGTLHLKKPTRVSLKANPTNEKIALLVGGQGVLLFQCPYTDVCKISILNVNGTDGFSFQITPVNVVGMRLADGSLLIDPQNNRGLLNKKGAYYWLSIDSQNQRFYAGIGEARIENAIYKYEWTWGSDQDKERRANKLLLESLSHIEVIDTIQPLALLRDPITRQVPMIVADTDSLTIDNVASGAYLPHSNLDNMGQKLYHCISGKNFVLDDASFPDFSKAIEQSIRKPGLWCYERLKQKATEFNKDQPDINETYLRITLGENNGESPGIPYVIEIWPVGHYSPIHNHAGASAIIRVLHGSINVSLYSFLCGEVPGIEPFGKVDFHKGDITWISPTLNQIHQLKNLEQNKDTCITVQCYMYEQDDSRHYDYFDYINANGGIQQYEPDSDMDFVQFKELMRKEWQAPLIIDSPVVSTGVDYKSMTLVGLKKLCKERKIKGASTLNRAGVLELLKKNIYK